MFDWLVKLWYNFLYSLTKLLLNVINYIMLAVNKISGIETITFEGEETDFITYLIQSDKVTYAMALTSIMGFMLLILLTVIQIVMTYTKEKNEESPLQVAKRAAKNIMVLLLVPTFMVAFILITNAFVKGIYQATMVGSTSLPQYMFSIFAADATTKGVSVSDLLSDSYATLWSGGNDARWSALDMEEFGYFYSYLIGGIVVYLLLTTAMMLIERAISIVFLYIISPFVVAASVMDDGAKFKSWRDQILIKFLTGHGAIIAINVYLLVCSLVMDDKVVFFEDSSGLNNFLKLLFVVGGALAVKQTQAIVGNLIQVGAGDKAVAENERAAAGMAHALTSPIRGVKNVVGAAAAAANFANDAKQYGFGSAVASRLGFKTSRDYGGMSQAQKDIKSSRDAMKEQRDIRQAQRIANLIQGKGINDNDSKVQATNHSNFDQLGGADKKKSLGENMVDNAIADSNNEGNINNE